MGKKEPVVEGVLLPICLRTFYEVLAPVHVLIFLVWKYCKLIFTRTILVLLLVLHCLKLNHMLSWGKHWRTLISAC